MRYVQGIGIRFAGRLGSRQNQTGHLTMQLALRGINRGRPGFRATETFRGLRGRDENAKFYSFKQTRNLKIDTQEFEIIDKII